MAVKVRNALTDAVVHRNERSLRLHGPFHGPCKQLSPCEEWVDEGRREVHESLVVFSGNQQHVTGEHGSDIEESHGYLVIKNEMGRLVSSDDLAEHTHRRRAYGVAFRT